MSVAAWSAELRKHQLIYPDERIVTFLASHYSNREQNSQRNALDIGFSSGRHLALLNDYQFNIFGIDYNPEAVETAVSLFGESLRPHLSVSDIKDKPFDDNLFDVVIYFGVAFLRPLTDMLHDLRQVHRMMKSGGKMIVNFRSPENWFFGRGTTQDGLTYQLDDSAGPYKGMTYTFLDWQQASDLLHSAGFRTINHERVDLYKKNQTEHHSWWVFWVEKM